MRSRPVAVGAVMLLVLIGGALVLLDRGRAGREDQPTRFGVLARVAIGTLDPSRVVCQNPVDVDLPSGPLGLAFDTGARPGPALRVTVRDLASRRVVRDVPVRAGWTSPLGGFLTVPLGRPLEGNRSYEICARNVGRRAVGIVGDSTVYYSDARIGTRSLNSDWGIFFPMSEPVADRRNHLEMAGDMLRRATVMRPGIVTPLFYALLAVLIVVAGPLLLWRAVLSASAEDPDDEPSAGRADPPSGFDGGR